MSVGSIRRKCLAIPATLVAVFAIAAVSAAPALASGKPFVETKPATEKHINEATLNGVVNPNGAETKYHFEYGTTDSYGKSTAAVSVGSGTTNLEELQKITGLSALTEYDFRIVATNSNGTTNGSNKAFISAGPEFKPVPTKKKFTSASGAALIANEGYGNYIECTKSSATGEITSARKLGKVIEVFTGCDGSGFGHRGCSTNSVGAKAGEIVTNPLSGELGLVAKGVGTGVGLRLEAETGKSWFTLQGSECNIEAVVDGTLAAEVSPVGVGPVLKSKLTFQAGASGEEIKEITLDSDQVEKLELDYGAGRMYVVATDELTFEEALEVT
jgi:hypothetical protein